MLARDVHLTHLACAACGSRHDADALATISPCCAKPLLARYDLERARERVTRASLARGDPTLWRFRDVLPVRDRRFETTLGEGMTPLLRAPRLGERLRLPNLLVKDESANPTGSFKARGLALAVSRNVELGVRAFAVPSAGNAGAALAAYAARSGTRAFVAMPRDVPAGIVRACRAFGAEVELVDGLITDAAKRVAVRVQDSKGQFMDVSTLKEPYRVEGKKTMAFELALDLEWEMPDALVYPTGGGTGLVGMWKAFEEMEALGLIGSARPRMYAVQAEGCAPIVRAFERGATHAEPWENAATSAHGLRVPRAIADFLMLAALRESGGGAIAVSEEAIALAEREAAALEGFDAGPESAAAFAGARALAERGDLAQSERVVVFHTGGASQYA